MVAGIAFKFGAAPFHMWLPDVYHGAPTPITLFIGSAPKLAAFGMAFRLLAKASARWSPSWRMLIALAVLSLVIGNLIALAQTNLKRMLAYSTISHVGFLFLGLAGAAAGLRGGDVLRDQLRDHGGRRVRRDRGAVAQGLRGRPHRRLQGPERAQPVDGGAGAVLMFAGGRAAVPRLLGQAGGAPRGARRRPAVAGASCSP